MTRPTLALLLALLAGACAYRTRPPSQNAGSSPAAQPAADGKRAEPVLLCRTERPTGSNIMTRVCYSQDDLDAMGPAAQDDMRRAIQKGTIQPRRN